jgi:hypothetical protein
VWRLCVVVPFCFAGVFDIALVGPDHDPTRGAVERDHHVDHPTAGHADRLGALHG